MDRRRHRPERADAGYSVIELALVVAIVGILAGLATPLFLSYYQAATLRLAAEEVAAFVNQGRQLGIRRNTGVCVHITPAALQYKLGNSCGVAAWVGPGTDAAGNVSLPQGITLATNTDPIFSYLGAANPGATITVTNSQDGQAVHVTVAVSGRVSVGP